MMRKPLDFKWESIDKHTYRARVLGGWIVVIEMVSSKGNCAITSQFIIDKFHEWKISSIEEKNSPNN